MLELIVVPSPHVVAFRAAGRVTADELQVVIDAIEDAKRQHPKVSLYAEIDAMRWMTATALIRDIGYGLTQIGQLEHFHRVAITSNRLWVRPIAMLENQLFHPVKIRVFSNREKQDAMTWICQLPEAFAGPTANRPNGDGDVRKTG
ncbi:STAS/SEC14 domain-containing protein [Halomonas sp. McH1-25]|uniref:STAS/SEC14 domain-containing protein n=1 Tax=unclassified Halomonas TaxID=2609666 RepID=UPI001EF5FDC1|nr:MULTISPECIES: STAS/SEC14 domain-containing protein [unclassified Halomonas]MCG7600856.1 STAS/SEC14 domain-containing protein [Halomonas sp. McH1-25]MCP1343800.1 STAS/SEC14 domain-containing protein [Halomonas sp. FL8]MCP1360035.1 STAS/SEC14 domain-containing protein [Halomonas sp. BBD45]MCP1363940.1 STAS/SEC14 domain-containing protein [Halomonas sp. BBD48]